MGDELVRLDGKPVEELIREFGKDMGFGNQKAARRLAAQRLVLRVPAVMPNAPDTPETSEAVFRNQAGDLKTYTLKWIKQGTPIENMSPLPSPFTLNSERDPLEVIRKLQNWRWEPDKPASIKKPTLPERQQWGGTQYLQQQGRLPVFNAPPGWRLRLGAGPNDVFVSGTYTYEGKRMGLIRIADFDPPSRADAVRQMEAEIAFFKANTDGLVVDLMGNAGGDCIGLDYAKLLIPERFWFFGAQVLANRYWLYEAESALQAAMANDAEPWVIETIAFYADEIRNALKGNRAMTGSIPACQPTQSAQPAAPTFEHDPARAADGTLLAYDKPVIFLVDELSASFGDVFRR